MPTRRSIPLLVMGGVEAAECLTFRVFNTDSDRATVAAIRASARPTPWDRPWALRYSAPTLAMSAQTGTMGNGARKFSRSWHSASSAVPRTLAYCSATDMVDTVMRSACSTTKRTEPRLNAVAGSQPGCRYRPEIALHVQRLLQLPRRTSADGRSVRSFQIPAASRSTSRRRSRACCSINRSMASRISSLCRLPTLRARAASWSRCRLVRYICVRITSATCDIYLRIIHHLMD